MSTNFGNFTQGTPLGSQFAVGYSTATSGGERRYLWSDVQIFILSVLGGAAYASNSAFDPAGAANAVNVSIRASLGTAAFVNTTFFDLSGAAANAVANVTKASIGLGLVENTALSTWPGSANLATVGNVTAGTWSANTIAANRGGTGIAAYAIGDILFAASAISLSRLAAGSNVQVLIGGPSPSWAQVNLGTMVSGNLAPANLAGGLAASSSTFWRGDGTWAVPPTGNGSGSSINVVGTPTANQIAVWVNATALQGISNLTANVFNGGLNASASTFLRGDGTWAAATSNSSGTKTYAVFGPQNNQPLASAFAQLDTRNNIAVLSFDDTTEESGVFVSIIPEAASLGSGLKVRIHWTAATATTGVCRWGAAFMAMNAITSISTDSFDTASEANCNALGTSGFTANVEILVTAIANLVAGTPYRLKVYRDVTDAADTMVGDAQLSAVEVRSAA